MAMIEGHAARARRRARNVTRSTVVMKIVIVVKIVIVTDRALEVVVDMMEITIGSKGPIRIEARVGRIQHLPIGEIRTVNRRPPIRLPPKATDAKRVQGLAG